MDVLNNLAFGFSHALTLQNLMFCAIGCTVGTLVGLLPGLGPLATIRSEEHTSELQSLRHLVCRLLLEKKKRADRRRSSRWPKPTDSLWEPPPSRTRPKSTR